MSSGIEYVGALAAAVVLGPALALAGAGKLALMGGAALVDAGISMQESIEEKQRQKFQQQKQRHAVAVCGHNQLIKACQQVLAQLDQTPMDQKEREQMRQALRQICQQPLPEEAHQIEMLNVQGHSRLEQLLARQERLAKLQLEEPGLYSGVALAELMADMKLAFSAAVLAETKGDNIQASDPAMLERAKLNTRLQETAGRVVEALEYIVDLSQNYGLSEGNNAWFLSCFNGVDQELSRLYQPTTSNEALKKGIRRLEEQLEQYDMVQPTIEKARRQIAALYPGYAQAAAALGVPVHKQKHFTSVEALEQELEMLRQRARRAEQCAAIYQKLGASAYICYAWDEELRQLGYHVKSRKQITELVGGRPERAKLGQQEMPFYQWKDGEMSQMYSISPDCSLQLIVHADGTTSMQTVSESEADVRKTQAHHCSQMKQLHERLRKNWFIMYDYEETADAGQVLTAQQWALSEDNAWKQQAPQELVRDQRQQEQTVNNKVMRK